jgi:signal transduction histidine kinase
LAEAARAIERHPERGPLKNLPDGTDELGELGRAFRAMVDQLLLANEALRREVDERKRVEAEREQLLIRERHASRLKDEFLAAVSHELRTPLNVVLGWVQILDETTPDSRTANQALAAISRNVKAQARVIEDLVDVSRLVTGKMHLEFATVDLRRILESALEVVGPGVSAKSIHLRLECADARYEVRGDRDRLQQIFWNVLANAVKFTPAHGRITVTLVTDGPSYLMTVSDTGSGIAPSFLPHVFERFRQADQSPTRTHGGLGLGLSIVKELVELHGGTVTAASDGIGCGASFSIRLPKQAPAGVNHLGINEVGVEE